MILHTPLCGPEMIESNPSSTLSLPLSTYRIIFEVEETDPKLQWIGRRSFGGFNRVIETMWEQNCETFGLSKKKRKRTEDEIKDEEMADRFTKHVDGYEGRGGGGGGKKGRYTSYKGGDR